MTSIGNRAFDLNDIPTIISLIENPSTIIGKTSNTRTFTINTFNNATLYVPKGNINKYKATGGWKDFVFIEESDNSEAGINQIRDDKNIFTDAFQLDGLQMAQPKKGLNIVRMSDGTTKKIMMK